MPVCDYCKKTIRGKFWRYQSKKTICAACRKALPKCKACGIAVKKGVSRGGKIYCFACSKKLKKCYFCNGFLIGEYLSIAGRNVCLKCKKKLPRCVRCNLPVKEYLLVNGKKLCLSCSGKVDYCAICRLPLIGRFHKFSGDSRKFCSRCAKYRDRCDMCNLPLSVTSHRLSDGRTLCNACMKKAVRTASRAKGALRKVLSFLHDDFSMKIRKTTKLQVVDAKTLTRVRKSVRAPGQKDRRALGIFVRKGDVFEVYIESFLPYPLCIGVLAHEYTHAWQADNFPPSAGILWMEGLAEWIAYRTLLHYKHKKQAVLVSKQQDIYGQGFRKVRAIEQKCGVEQVIARVLKKVGAKKC